MTSQKLLRLDRPKMDKQIRGRGKGSRQMANPRQMTCLEKSIRRTLDSVKASKMYMAEW